MPPKTLIRKSGPCKLQNKTQKLSLKQENVDEIPVFDIKIEPIDDSYQNSLQQESIIPDIIQNILFSLDLLIQADPDTIRSSDVRNNILSALFCYRDIIEDVDFSLSNQRDITESQYIDDHGLFDITKEVVYSDNSDVDEKKLNVDDIKREPFVVIEQFPQKRLMYSVSHGNEDDLYPVTSEKKKVREIDRKTRIASKELYSLEIPRYKCDICEISMISKHHFTKHKQFCTRRHFCYGNPVLEDYWNSIKCPLCDVKCTHRANLKRHFVSHRIKDIETAFKSIRDQELDPNNPDKNIRLLEDFIRSLDTEERLKKELDAIEQWYKQEDDETIDTNEKPTIDKYVKFNLKRIVFDIDINKDLYCFPCNLTFETKEQLEDHRMKINGTDAFVCNHCDKTFDIPFKLINHTKTHTGLYNPESPFLNYSVEDFDGCPSQIDYNIRACKYCLVLFVQECSLRIHLSFYNKHLKCITKSYRSPKGSGTKRTPQGIRRTEDGKLQCNICGKSYSNYHVFSEHLASHSDVSKFHCDCGKGFKTKQRLKYHINLVHNLQSRVFCEVCGTRVLFCNLKRHMKVHSNDKPFKCDYCNKSFKYKEVVTAHMRTHTLEKPWQCQYCAMAFSEKRTYNIHVNIHEGKTPYKCNLCPSAFVSKLKLNKHALEHRK